MLYSVTRQRPALNIKEGVFYDGIPGYVIRIGKKDPGAKTVYDIKIHDHTDDRGNINVLLAEEGEMYTVEDGKDLIVNLKHGARYEEPRPGPGRCPSPGGTRPVPAGAGRWAGVRTARRAPAVAVRCGS